MKSMLLAFSLFLSLSASAAVCNKSVIALSNPNTGSVSYALSDNNLNPAPNCKFLYNLKKEATDIDCARIAIYQGYSCGQTITEVMPVYETDMSHSRYIETNTCWACY